MRRTRVPELVLVTALVGATVVACGDDGPDPQPLPAAGPDAAASCRDGGEDAKGSVDGGMVSTPDPYATEVGCDVLADGGTAADALVAAQYVLGLTEPNYSGPGGGGLAVYHDAQSGTTESFDGTVYAPEDEDRFDDESVGVPQTDRLMDTLRDRFGTRSLSDLTAPAVQLATDGFEVSDRLADAMDDRSELFDDIPEAGDTMTNPEYAGYLEGLDGTDDPVEPEEPLCVDYRDQRVCGSPSTATGFMVTAETLGILDHLDLEHLSPYEDDDADDADDADGTEDTDDADDTDGPVARATAQHLVTEAERVAFTNANTWMADAASDEDRTDAYIDEIVTSQEHLEDAADSIRQKRTLEDLEPETLGDRSHRYEDSDDQGTSQITVRDSAGSMASLTTTLQRSFGSGKKENGYFLNNSLDNFSSSATSGEPNTREPGAHPRTTMSPVLVFGDGDDPVIGLGSPGGRKIPSYVVKALVAMVDWDLDPAEAVAMPNFGATNRNAVYSVAQSGRQNEMRDLLEDWGHDLESGEFNSGLSVIRVQDDRVSGAADQRREGSVAGVDLE